MHHFLILLCLFSLSMGITPENSFKQPATSPDNLSPFVNYFLLLVQSTKDLQNIFASAADANKNYDVLYNETLKAAVKYKSTDPQSVAKNLADAITSALDLLTPINKAKVISSAYDKLLKDLHLLTIDNSAELARLLADSFLGKYHFIELTPGPVPRLKVIGDGGLEFNKIMNIVSPEITRDFVQYLISGYRNLTNFV